MDIDFVNFENGRYPQKYPHEALATNTLGHSRFEGSNTMSKTLQAQWLYPKMASFPPSGDDWFENNQFFRS